VENGSIEGLVRVLLDTIGGSSVSLSTTKLIGWLNDAFRKTDLLSNFFGIMWREVLGGWPYLPKGVAPADPEAEHAVIGTLMEETSNKFAIQWDSWPPQSALTDGGQVSHAML
jgi:hypothetical protein